MAHHALHSHIDKWCGSEHLCNMAEGLWITAPDAIIFRNNELDGNPHVCRNLWKTCAPFLCFSKLWHGTRDVPFWVQLRQFLRVSPGRSIHDSDLNRLIHNHCRIVIHQHCKCCTCPGLINSSGASHIQPKKTFVRVFCSEEKGNHTSDGMTNQKHPRRLLTIALPNLRKRLLEDRNLIIERKLVLWNRGSCPIPWSVKRQY